MCAVVRAQAEENRRYF